MRTLTIEKDGNRLGKILSEEIAGPLAIRAQGHVTGVVIPLGDYVIA